MSVRDDRAAVSFSPGAATPLLQRLRSRTRFAGTPVVQPAQRVATSARKEDRSRNSYAEFHPRTIAIDDAPKSPISGLVVIALLAMITCAVAWAFFGRIASYTSAMGKIQTTGRTKIVEALATGKVIKISVRDGDSVAAGAIVVDLDPTDALAARTIVASKLTDLRAEVLRSRTEIAAARADPVDPTLKIDWGKDIPAAVRARENLVAHADLAKLAAQIATLISSRHQKEAERDTFANNITAQKALVAVTQENLTMIENLLKQGFNSEAKYLDMKATLDGQQVMQTSYEGGLDRANQAIAMVDSEIAKTRDVFTATQTQTISNDEQAIVDLDQQLVEADRALAHMTLRSPVDGVVHATAVTTIGQVVKPGQQLMEVVPKDAPIEILAYVDNAQAGFVRKGDHADVKVDAFTYNVYGSLDATVTDVASDALQLLGKPTAQTSSFDGAYGITTAAEKTGSLQYPVTLRASRSTMRVEGKDIPLVPGMGVDVEIETENLRAIDYVLTPIEELFSTAAHER